MNRAHVLAAAGAAVIVAGALAGSRTAPVDPAVAADFTVTPAQLQINQRISQAAVRRANEALNLLGPVRPAASTDKDPINPFTAAQRAKGWPTAALADGAVTGPKIAADAVGEAALTPSIRSAVGGVRRLGVVRLTGGQSQVLVTAGPISLTARCTITPGGNDAAEVFVGTTLDGVAFEAADSSTNVVPGTPEANRHWVEIQAVHGGTAFDQTDNGIAVAPDGTVVVGQPFAAVNLPGRPPGECTFGGVMLIG
ncbi:MAG: hypothetical protein MUE51_04385 [Thermoleophilia bacterium]|jgi:hypothetical protein|nr:hypothetical protein [Thermoleophilia bacterium]